MHSYRHPWTQLNQTYFHHLQSATAKMLLGREHSGSGVLSENFNYGFAGSIAVMGPTVCFEELGNVDDRKVIKDYIDSRISSSGKVRGGLVTVDQCMLGWPIIDLYLATGEQKYAKAAHEMYDYLCFIAHNSRDGMIIYREDIPDYRLVDTLGMACPFLYYYGEVFDVPEAKRLSVLMLREFFNHAIEVKSGLPFHAYNINGKKPSGLLGWTRGVGWLMLGTIDTLQYMPANSVDRSMLVAYYRRLTDAVLIWQQANGCWSWAMNVPGTQLDTSGTAMIAYSIERAVHIGILEDKYLKVVDRALLGLVKETRDDGLVDHALAECGGVGIYPQMYDTAAWAQGPTLALVSLVSTRSTTHQANNKCFHSIPHISARKSDY